MKRLSNRTLIAISCFVGGCVADSGAPIVGDALPVDGGTPDTVQIDVGPQPDTGGTDVPASDLGGFDAGGDTGGDAVVRPPDTGDDSGIPTGPICGNGRVEIGEVCDDGNNFPGDGCNADCSSDERCGNGIVDLGETCDDGNVTPGDGCDASCRNEEGCGNGILEVGEQCDDGNGTDGDGCSSECVREVFVATDTDGDTISDFDEGSGAIDSDGDGFPDTEDLDSDADGILDSIEAGDDDMISEPVDTDGDGIYDFRDTDADGDGIPDATEGTADIDGDGFGNYADPDSDGDYVPDAIEGIDDSDGDGLPDYIDFDSDNDTILDAHELFADSDEDGTPNRLDLDSDNDGLSDAREAGDADPETYPFDLDADGQPDYIDIDSDGDGLPDGSEPGCAFGGPDADDPDSDDDGYSDLAEELVGSDPCRFNTDESFEEFTDFFFILPAHAPPDEAPLEFSSDIVQADVHIAMDTTGSMGGEISNLRSAFSSQIFPGVQDQVPDVAFGVSTFDDYPCNGHGSAGSGDQPFILRQRVTTDIVAAQTAMNTMPLHYGADYFESGYESMYQVATGAGVSDCGASVPAFNPAADRIAGVADGDIGGVGFRDGSFPIVVHVTDAPSHEESAYGPFAASSTEAIDALQAIQARFIGVASGSDPRSQLENVARSTGGVVPVCAWDDARPAGCGASQCCTGASGGGRASEAGQCPLVFDISSSGTGLGTAVVTAISALANTTAFDVTTNVRRDDDEFLLTGIDTRCFIQSITPDSFVATSGCATTPVAADLSPVDGVLDSFSNVTPGTQLFFDVVAQNDGCVAETELPQAFTAFIDVVGDGLTVLDTQTVTIIVPADSASPSTVP